MRKRKLSDISHIWVVGGIVVVSLLVAVAYSFLRETEWSFPNRQKNGQQTERPPHSSKYPLRTTVATEFWVGEEADESNAYIHNRASAWTRDWVDEFGGVDDPDDRCEGYVPCGFTPQENPFYVALPFNDIGSDGKPKDDEILRRIPWYTGSSAPGVSIMKNRWVEIRYNGKTAYGQIEDVGPMNENDAEYVFGTSEPKYEAGLDMSPAIGDYLGTTGKSTVQWRFVEATEVPDGPWTNIVTTSQIKW